MLLCNLHTLQSDLLRSWFIVEIINQSEIYECQACTWHLMPFSVVLWLLWFMYSHNGNVLLYGICLEWCRAFYYLLGPVYVSRLTWDFHHLWGFLIPALTFCNVLFCYFAMVHKWSSLAYLGKLHFTPTKRMSSTMKAILSKDYCTPEIMFSSCMRCLQREMLADPQTTDSHYLDLPVAFLSW